MSPEQVVNRRMHNLLLWGQGEADPIQAVARLEAT